MENRKSKQEALKLLVKENEAVILAIGNESSNPKRMLDVEFAVNGSADEIYFLLVELFKNEEVRNEARKAILFSDYGKKEISSLDIN